MNTAYPMKILPRYLVLLLVLLLAAAIVPSAAAAGPDYATTYTITLLDNGTALWTVEYRTPLASTDDSAAFGNYTRDLDAVYLPQLESLMVRSAAQAAKGTGRPMRVEDFSANATVQTTPTGTFGVVTFSFAWPGFATGGSELSAGDAFAGGLYLPKDNTLIVRYPEGYAVKTADPAPDQRSNGLIWYGLRSFSPGQPFIVLEKEGIPFIPVLVVIIVIIAATGAAILIYRRRKAVPGTEAAENGDDPGHEPAAALSGPELYSLEERILRILNENNGEIYQSELVRTLGLPKSTVSSTLNDLHRRGSIIKIRKGRENLIRRA